MAMRSALVEPWYTAYALLGTMLDGVVPILIPLAVSEQGTAVEVGLAIAAIRLGGVAAPVWGGLADRYRRHREVLVIGQVLASVAVAAFAVTHATALRLLLALLLGIGAYGTATAATLLVVERSPRREWGPRLGWLQTFYGGGQVGGLLLAAVLSQVSPRAGLLVAAGLTAVGGWLGWRTLWPAQRAAPSVPVSPGSSSPNRQGQGTEVLWCPSSRLAAQVHGIGRRRLPFRILLALWLIVFTGSAAVFTLYPVLMRQVFDVSPAQASSVYALATALSLGLYPAAGRWCGKTVPAHVLQAGLGVRLAAWGGLLALGVTHAPGRGWLASLAFVIGVLSWPLLSVSGSELAARFASGAEGEGMGVFNAVSALANALGAGLGGWVAWRWGYNGATSLALLGAAGGLGLAGMLWRAPWRSGLRRVRKALWRYARISGDAAAADRFGGG